MALQKEGPRLASRSATKELWRNNLTVFVCFKKKDVLHGERKVQEKEMVTEPLEFNIEKNQNLFLNNTALKSSVYFGTKTKGADRNNF